jgi:hypothetical protein
MRDIVIAPRTGLPRVVRLAALRDAVGGETSWRGVMRRLGFTTSRTGRVLRQICDEHQIDYSHFRLVGPDDASIVRIIPGASSWAEALEGLGYAPDSGSARATIRKHCQRLGVDTSHLRVPTKAAVGASMSFSPQLGRLRAAGPYLVAAALTLAGAEVSLACEGAAYDLLLDQPGGGLLRVQVKTTTRRANNTWVCKLTRSEYRHGSVGGHGHAKYSAEDIDMFACVDGAGQIYLIPIEAVEGQRAIHVRRYQVYRLPMQLVGLTGLEPATFGPPDRRATKLRHSPCDAETTGEP